MGVVKCSLRKGPARVLIISGATGSKNMCWGWHLGIQPCFPVARCSCRPTESGLERSLPRQRRFQCSNPNHLKEQKSETKHAIVGSKG